MTCGTRRDRHAAGTAASHVVFDESALLARIGRDLRDLNGDVDGFSLPSALLPLTNLIDGKGRHGSEANQP